MSEDNPTEPIPTIPQPDSAERVIQHAFTRIADRGSFPCFPVSDAVLRDIVFRYVCDRLLDEGVKKAPTEPSVDTTVNLLMKYPPLRTALIQAYQAGAYAQFAYVQGDEG